MRFQNLTGQKFGRLTALRRCADKVFPSGRRKTQWECICDCGNSVVVYADALKSGNTGSCGCYHREVVSKTIATNKRKDDKVYFEWATMKSRCYNENAEHYEDYGGRGITVCDRWRESFDLFFDDVSKLPHFREKGFSLNRIDNNGNYEPNNVEWADRFVQANNRRNNRFITYNGKTQTIAQWARETGIPNAVINKRAKLGWNVDKILTTPLREYKSVK